MSGLGSNNHGWGLAMLWRKVCFLLFMFGLSAGCFSSSDGPAPKDPLPTFPVTGEVHIDGAPAAGVMLYFYPEDAAKDQELDPADHGAHHIAVTGPDGKFQVNTYNSGDGIPAGSYAVGFFWPGKNPPPTPAFGPDSETIFVDPEAVPFNRKYGNPVKSGIKVAVEAGKPADMGVLDLAD